ncbi:hypothetical protein AJ80_04864 [Polytolypa hystricis UAMH7299]|uniref:Aminotransferase class I/classII large domain-containing protein n=1 Tax=Polytolypa hystricis (strain UAMH7299) TaxID=1447883 RepID=A0A2B7Y917_POLH7|nr:hypothetical protein AJ80_04864 [Polytolypa hystricis UAMH7299]
MQGLLHSFQDCLDQRKLKGRHRTLQIPPKESIDLSSNDFLSLSTSDHLRQRFIANVKHASDNYPLASGGSRLLDGNSVYAEELETFIASFHDAPSGLLFNSGYDANMAIFSCIPQKGDLIIYDELVHASAHEGMRLSRSTEKVSFRHNSAINFRDTLENAIQKDPLLRTGSRNVFVAVESLYSMDGDFAPIKDILNIMEDLLPRQNGYMIVDEAHSTGVFGPRGAGIVQELGVQDRVFLRMHTFGKALGSHGAIVLCSQLTRDYMINYSRSLIYTTAMPLPSLVSIRTAYELMDQGETISSQSQLQSRISHVQTLFAAAKSTHANPSLLRVRHHPRSPIFSLQTPFALELAGFVQQEGMTVRAIRPPTVPKGTDRVRVCLHAKNTEAELERLVKVVEGWLRVQVQREEGCKL